MAQPAGSDKVATYDDDRGSVPAAARENRPLPGRFTTPFTSACRSCKELRASAGKSAVRCRALMGLQSRAQPGSSLTSTWTAAESRGEMAEDTEHGCECRTKRWIPTAGVRAAIASDAAG